MNTHNWSNIVLTGQIPHGYQLLQESAPFKILDRKKTINEDISNAIGDEVNVMKLVGVFQRAGEKNANGRIYPYDVLKEAIDDLDEPMEERRVMGEFDHPSDAKIHLDRVSHLITNLWMENKRTVLGEIEVINDDRCPCGSMLASLIDRNVNIGISSRGVGDMDVTYLSEGEEAYEVQPGFHFVTFDVVAEPSVQGTQLRLKTESRIKRTKSTKSKKSRIAENRNRRIYLEEKRKKDIRMKKKLRNRQILKILEEELRNDLL